MGLFTWNNENSGSQIEQEERLKEDTNIAKGAAGDDQVYHLTSKEEHMKENAFMSIII